MKHWSGARSRDQALAEDMRVLSAGALCLLVDSPTPGVSRAAVREIQNRWQCLMERMGQNG